MEDSFVDSIAGQLSGVAVTVWLPRRRLMTAGTLSTLPSLLSKYREEGCRPERSAAVVSPLAAAADSLRTTRLCPEHVFEVQLAPRDESSWPAVDAAPRASGLLDQLEYEARGLHNLVGFAARCLDDRCTPDERLRWREQLDRANARLEALHEAGLPRDFLTNPRWRERPAPCVPSR